MIELHQFSIGYGEHGLLSNVNVTIGNGCLTALIGRNGSGKSTLLRAIAGLNKNYAGHININGHDMTGMKAEQLARNLAYVSTERTRIPNLRCRDVVALGRAPYTDWLGRLGHNDSIIVDRALETVGMANYAERTMDTMSDGECQRIMIARALAQDTPIILLDEPTSFLDLPNRYELCNLLGRLAHNQEKCILFSTHELDIAMKMCDYLAVVDNPVLHNLSVEKVRDSGLIDRLFNIPG
ncbi:MAG: ABC transporter ATP-binding protein [Ruminococcus flavefaciens]|nr:ABC transporter ATP-binding protein [Ruminococcus flavefaciens]